MMPLLQYTIVNKLNVYAQKFTVETIIVMCFLIFISTGWQQNYENFKPDTTPAYYTSAQNAAAPQGTAGQDLKPNVASLPSQGGWQQDAGWQKVTYFLC